MEFQKIKTLIERYFAGSSTLEEERLLRQYFSNPDVDVRLREYAPLFQLFTQEKRRKLDERKAAKIEAKTLGRPAKRVSLSGQSLHWIARIAAVLVLAVGIWWAYQSQGANVETAAIDWSKYEITDEEEAYKVTKNALLQVSKSLNEGASAAASKMDKMQEMGKFFK